MFEFLRKIFQKPKSLKWKNIEYFDPVWKDRIQMMTSYIRPNESVVDFGCGQMWTKEFLPENCTYLGVDYISRGEGSIVCDFNQKQFPQGMADVAFVSGCLEYIEDTNWFVKKVGDNFNKCIISYCSLDDFPDIEARRKRTWVNDFSKHDLISLFKENKFELIEQTKTKTNNCIFHFKKLK